MPKVESVVFLSLVLDLFAFTIPLPLFPRLIEWYTLRETSDPNGFLSRTLQFVTSLRGLLYKSGVQSHRWDVVLLGGLMGSAFSTLQFLVSPKIGALSDKYGRKRVLLITMIGNILSAVVWIQSTSFASYMLSRVIGGLSEGNVQLAIAILSDVTTPENRSKALAHVGIAFAICFCIGPPIGAYFASKPIPTSMNKWGPELNVYATPAILTLILLVAETIFLAYALPETRGIRAARPPKAANGTAHANGNGLHVNGNGEYAKVAGNGDGQHANGNGHGNGNGQHINGNGHVNGTSKPSNGMVKPTQKRSVQNRIVLLAALRNLHFLFLGLFSGVEFTLTFLTFDLLDWNNTQNGKLIGSIGIVSALLQGGYVRRSTSKIGEGVMARRGVSSCFVALVLLSLLPLFVETNPTLTLRLLQAAAVCMAFTSATVVNSLTAFASLQCDEGKFDEDTGKFIEEHPQLAKGKALGKFRSSGQLGRAIGPLLACASYWTFGPSVTYAVSAAAMCALSLSMKKIAATKSV